MGNLRDTLKQAVKQLAFKTSVQDLQKKGVQHVNVLGLDRIIALIDEAVHHGLKSRLVGFERQAVAEATRAEFLRLLRSNEDLQRQKSEVEKQKERAEDEVDHLRREIELQQQALQVRLQRGALDHAARYAGENAELARKVGDMFAALMAQGRSADVALTQEKVLELVLDAVAGERKSAESAQQALHDREVENLQRRLNKLNESLQQSERRLQQMAALKHLDSGISSVYREVQGLDDADNQVARKRELMGEIFKANLALQKRTGS